MDFSNNIYVLIVDVILQYISSACIDCETFNPSRLQVIFSTLFNGVIIVFPQKKKIHVIKETNKVYLKV